MSTTGSTGCSTWHPAAGCWWCGRARRPVRRRRRCRGLAVPAGPPNDRSIHVDNRFDRVFNMASRSRVVGGAGVFDGLFGEGDAVGVAVGWPSEAFDPCRQPLRQGVQHGIQVRVVGGAGVLDGLFPPSFGVGNAVGVAVAWPRSDRSISTTGPTGCSAWRPSGSGCWWCGRARRPVRRRQRCRGSGRVAPRSVRSKSTNGPTGCSTCHPGSGRWWCGRARRPVRRRQRCRGSGRVAPTKRSIHADKPDEQVVQPV